MYINYLKNDFKNIIRDKMLIFMVFFPVLFALIGRYGIAFLLKSYPDLNNRIIETIVIFLLMMISYMYGAIGGFTIADDRDDNVLINIAISPLSIFKYLSYRLITIYVLSIAGTTFVVLYSQVSFPTYLKMEYIDIIHLSSQASLMAVINSLVINCFAKNKVEAFALMKMTGNLMIVSLLSLIWFDWREFLFSFAPGMWTAKSMQSLFSENIYHLNQQSIDMNLSFNGYMIIGWIYSIIFLFLVYRLFKKKNNLG